MTRKLISRYIAIFIGTAILLLAFFPNILGGSHPVSKPFETEVQLRILREYAENHKEEFLKVDNLDNASFISVAKVSGRLWKYNEKGELLDSWGYPYVIGKDAAQITFMSPGLEQYNRKSWFQKWLEQ